MAQDVAAGGGSGPAGDPRSGGGRAGRRGRQAAQPVDGRRGRVHVPARRGGRDGRRPRRRERTRRPAIDVDILGDAHLGNFGMYGSPERVRVFDVNDFDEAGPGPWEWDVCRLAASAIVVERDHKAPKKEQIATAQRGAHGLRGDRGRADRGQAGRPLVHDHPLRRAGCATTSPTSKASRRTLARAAKLLVADPKRTQEKTVEALVTNGEFNVQPASRARSPPTRAERDPRGVQPLPRVGLARPAPDPRRLPADRGLLALGRPGQPRPAQLPAADRRQAPRRRDDPAGQGVHAVGARVRPGAARVRPTRAGAWSSSSAACRARATRCSAGRRSATSSTTSASSAT